MECLVTKLNGGENNPNLELFDELGVTFQTSSSDGRIEIIYSDWMDGNIIRAEEPVYIGYTGSKDAAILTDEYLIPSGSYKHFWIWPATINTDYTVYLPKRAMLTTLEKDSSVSISNFDTLRTMQSLEVLRPAGCNVDYDIIGSNVLGDYVGMGEGSKISLDKVSDGVTIINCQYDIISGSLYSLRDKTSMTDFLVRKTQKSNRITGSIEDMPLNSLRVVNIGNNSSISGSITHFNNSAMISYLQMNNSAVSGSINNLPITLEGLEVYGTNCSGDIKILADNQVAAGRTSGTLYVQSSGNIKNNGTAYTGTKTITFSGGSYTIS